MVQLDHVSLLGALMRTTLSRSIRESTWAVMALESVHLVGLTLLGGPAIVIGLGAIRDRGLRELPVATLTRSLLPVLWVGLLLMGSSGLLIALSMPFKYYNNAAFRWKMLLLVSALTLTAALLHYSKPESDASPSRHSTQQRWLALIALVLWLGVGLSGRLIGFL
jgi:hypothetical protein